MPLACLVGRAPRSSPRRARMSRRRAGAACLAAGLTGCVTGRARDEHRLVRPAAWAWRRPVPQHARCSWHRHGHGPATDPTVTPGDRHRRHRHCHRRPGRHHPRLKRPLTRRPGHVVLPPRCHRLQRHARIACRVRRRRYQGSADVPGAPAKCVHWSFVAVESGSTFVASKSVDSPRCSGLICSGRTGGTRVRLLHRIADEWSTITGGPKRDIASSSTRSLRPWCMRRLRSSAKPRPS